MDRRLFLLSGLAGVADPVSPVLKAVAPVAPPISRSGDDKFDAWAQSFFARAVGAGWPDAVVRRQLDGLAPDPLVIDVVSAGLVGFGLFLFVSRGYAVA